jgi:hypothetical protein
MRIALFVVVSFDRLAFSGTIAIAELRLATIEHPPSLIGDRIIDGTLKDLDDYHDPRFACPVIASTCTAGACQIMFGRVQVASRVESWPTKTA